MGAFIIQWGIGEIIELWPLTESGYDPESYRVAISTVALLQVSGLVWYFISQLFIKRKLDVS